MVDLAEGSSLAELQRYVKGSEGERGFFAQSALEKCLLLGEETGELFRAVRKASGLRTDPDSKSADVGEELADILNYVLAIANRFDIDLDAAFRLKELRNRQRVWR
jgi:NTP pyrophosphatase (non-canonical NTP hydrolase)